MRRSPNDICDGCGRKVDRNKMHAVENRYMSMRWFCPKCWDKELQRRQELWNLHFGMADHSGMVD